jgi:hypothetical protein
MPIKSFRGLIADGGQDKISLKTNNGSTGYRIVKFEIFPNNPGTESSESTVQVFKVEQASVSTSAASVDFSNNTLIAAAFYAKSAGVDNADKEVVIFDNDIFNQDIFVTHTDTASSQAVNYHIELEQIKLDLTENTVATLRDIRNNAAQSI